MHNSLAVAITVDSVLDYGLLPFRLQLHVATLQLDIFVYNCMWQHYMGLRFERWLPAFPFVTFSGRSLAVRIHSCAALRKRRLSDFFSKIRWPVQLQWTPFGTTASCLFVYNYMWQPYSWTFSFTIACGSITLGLRFERWLPAFPFTNACDHAVLLSGMSGFSGKPSGELLWKADSGGHYWTLKNQLMKSIIGILLNPSGKVVCISELTFLADSGILALTLQNFQCYSERGLPTALFWIFHLDIYGGMRWMHLCPRG